MKKKFEKLDQPLIRLLENLKYNDVYLFSIIKREWQKTVGLQISKYVFPVNYDKSNKVLYLKSLDESWEREILNNKKDFIKMIRKKLIDINVKNVIFVKGPVNAK